MHPHQTSGGQKFATQQKVKLEEKDEPDNFLLYACGPPPHPPISMLARFRYRCCKLLSAEFCLKHRMQTPPTLKLGGAGVTFAT